MSAVTDLRDAKAFAASYKPSDSDHPDLHSRVVMFERATSKEHGSDRAAAAHARTLVRFVRSLGLDIPKPAARKSAAKKSTSSGS